MNKENKKNKNLKLKKGVKKNLKKGTQRKKFKRSPQIKKIKFKRKEPLLHEKNLKFSINSSC